VTAPRPATPSKTEKTGARSSLLEPRWKIVKIATSKTALAMPMTTIAARPTAGNGRSPITAIGAPQ